jgi:hypothetical protein
MELKKVDESGVWVVLSPNDLLTVCNALNEVCNGIDVPEFATRMGVEREEVRGLLKAAKAVYTKVVTHNLWTPSTSRFKSPFGVDRPS